MLVFLTNERFVQSRAQHVWSFRCLHILCNTFTHSRTSVYYVICPKSSIVLLRALHQSRLQLWERRWSLGRFSAYVGAEYLLSHRRSWTLSRKHHLNRFKNDDAAYITPYVSRRTYHGIQCLTGRTNGRFTAPTCNLTATDTGASKAEGCSSRLFPPLLVLTACTALLRRDRYPQHVSFV